MTSEKILKDLRKLHNKKNIEGMAKFGINPEFALGISVTQLRRTAKTIGKDHQIALELWKSKIHEARILATIIDLPKEVNIEQMESWVLDFNSWDLCDQCCNNLFSKTVYAYDKALEWSSREETFVKRAGFTLMAVLAVNAKHYTDDQFYPFFERIVEECGDERNFVKKAVNWALRQIGKRNISLNEKAVEISESLSHKNTKSAIWIGRDAFNELTNWKIQSKLKP